MSDIRRGIGTMPTLIGVGPLWQQVAEAFSEEVADMPPGRRLPAERELCQRFEVSRVTLRKALLHLAEEGVLSQVHGSGWYVAAAPAKEWPNSLESFTETAARMGLTSTSIVLRAENAAATLDEAERLGIAPGTPVFVLERVRLLGGVRIALDRSLLPATFSHGWEDADFQTASVYRLLAGSGHDLRRAESTIEAREASDALASHLDIRVGQPVLVMHQLVTDGAERPVLSSTIRYAGDRYRLRTHFMRSALSAD